MLPPLFHYLYNNKDSSQFKTIKMLYTKLTDVRQTIQNIKLHRTNDADLFLNDQTDRFACYKFVTKDASDFFEHIGAFTNNDQKPSIRCWICWMRGRRKSIRRHVDTSTRQTRKD